MTVVIVTASSLPFTPSHIQVIAIATKVMSRPGFAS